jgi:Ran GTPase-activating protein (RanGAP) involved in mRNA processing and transport
MDKVLIKLELNYTTGKEKTKVLNNVPMNLTIQDLENLILSKLNFKENNQKKLNLFKLNDKNILDDQKNYQLSSIKLFSSKLSLNMEEIVDFLTEDTYEDNIKSLSNVEPHLPLIFHNFLIFDNNSKGYEHKLCKLGDKKFVYQEVFNLNLNKFSSISHPNIPRILCRVYNSSLSSYNLVGYLFEYIEGETLENKIYSIESDNERWRILLKLIEIIDYLHLIKIHDGNIHPKNVIISSSGQIYLRLSCQEPNPNSSLSVYSAPELFSQIESNPDFSPGLDIWSFGCLIYFLFSQSHPWKNNLFFAYENISRKQAFYKKDSVPYELLKLASNYDTTSRISSYELKLMIMLHYRDLHANNLENVSLITKESDLDNKILKNELAKEEEKEEKETKHEKKKKNSKITEIRNNNLRKLEEDSIEKNLAKNLERVRVDAKKTDHSNLLKNEKSKNTEISNLSRNLRNCPFKEDITDSESSHYNSLTITEKKIIEKFNNLKENSNCSINLRNYGIDDYSSIFLSKNLSLYCKNKLVSLNLSYNQITETGFATIFKQVIELETLDISNNHLGFQGCKYLYNILHYQKNLKKLYLEECSICNEGIKLISSYFKYLPKLVVLDISKNKITKNGAIILAKEIKSLFSLENFNISDNSIKSEGFQALYLEISKSEKTCNLKFSNIKLGKSAMNVFASFKEEKEQISRKDYKETGISNELTKEIHITFLNRIKSIDIAENNIGKSGAYLFAKSVKYLINLETLDLYKNNILSSGLKEICENINHLSNLRFINLGSNNLDDMGIISLARKLQYLVKLKSLNIHENQITSFGFKDLALSLKYLTLLQNLNLSNNKISDEGMKEFSNNLYSLTNLRYLHICGNDIRDEGILNLSAKFKYLPNLTHLKLSSNKISGESVVSIAEYIHYLKNLKEIDLNDNIIDEESRSILAKKKKEDILVIY